MVDVAVVGGGLAGLACARELTAYGLEPVVLEAADGIGGRVRTDRVDGFLLDRGFQVLLTAYPVCRDVLDLERLDIGRFEPGAQVVINGRRYTVSDPLRRPWRTLASAVAPVGSLADKAKVLRLRRRALSGELEEVWDRPQATSQEALEEIGFSEEMIDRFWRPFLGGVFLDRELATSSRMMDFVVRMFARGEAALPAEGMGAIPQQLAGSLPTDAVRTQAPVASVEPEKVVLTSGEVVTARAVVVATDGPAAGRLVSGVEHGGSRSTACLYFDAPAAPVRGGHLVLNGDGYGPVNNLCVPSEVCASYAPEGRALVSATVLSGFHGDLDRLERAVRTQLKGWFGAAVDGWRRLAVYRIEHALPVSPAWLSDGPIAGAVWRDGVVLCGDSWVTGSIEGAIRSGQAAARQVLDRLTQEAA